MTVTTASDLVYDPHDHDTIFNPHPLFRRMRDEAPLYYSEAHDFYAITRYEDIEKTLINRQAFISGKGITLDLLKSGEDIPPGTLLFEDPPTHQIHRTLLSRMFTPRVIASLEDSIRELCIRLLDPFVGAGGFDYVTDFAAQVPTRVIGMLLGIPEEDQEAVRDHFSMERAMTSGGYEEGILDGELFADYIDWRIEHPSDDLMTQLLNAEYQDANGETRTLPRNELLVYVNIIAAAGNETTRILIGNCAKLLSEFPDQRELLVADRSLVKNAIEEILRFEPNTLQNCRYVAEDVEFYGQTVPAGSAMVTLTPAGNRDERHFDDPDTLDVRRSMDHHLTFGFGTHYCLGQALARLEGRIALEEVLNRFPQWDVNLDESRYLYHSDMRGYLSLPVTTP